MFSLEKLVLERIISICAADSSLDWQVLPKVFHGIIFAGYPQKTLTPIHEELLSENLVWVWADGQSYPASTVPASTVTGRCPCSGWAGK